MFEWKNSKMSDGKLIYCFNNIACASIEFDILGISNAVIGGIPEHDVFSKDYKYSKTFDTLPEAKAWIEKEIYQYHNDLGVELTRQLIERNKNDI